MAITLNGTTGISNDGGYTGDGISFADTTPSNTLVTTTGGNVGIGTSSPNSNSFAKAVTLNGSSSAGYEVNIAGTSIGYFGGDSGQIYARTTGALPLTFGTNSSERMRIDSSGNFYIGTTSALGNNEKVCISQSINASALVTYNGSTSQTSPLSLLYANRNTTNGTFYVMQYYNSASGNTRFLITDAGNVQNVNNSYGAISDIKLKENIVDATPKLEKLNQVRVVNYNLIGQNQKQIGVIAQEIEHIFPSVIDELPDRDQEGNDLGTTTKSVKYSVFVPMLIKAIQEQQAIITELKTQLTDINLTLANANARIEALEQA